MKETIEIGYEIKFIEKKYLSEMNEFEKDLYFFNKRLFKQAYAEFMTIYHD